MNTERIFCLNSWRKIFIRQPLFVVMHEYFFEGQILNCQVGDLAGTESCVIVLISPL